MKRVWRVVEGREDMKVFIGVAVLGMVIAFAASAVCGQGAVPGEMPPGEGLTLWETIKAGQEVMVVLALLSVITVALIVYYLLSLRQSVLMPEAFILKIRDSLKRGDPEVVERLCREGDHFGAAILRAGLEHRGEGMVMVREMIQTEGARRAAWLWQRISYLLDVGIIAPLIGLLGTVLGMIQAFKVVAAGVATVKPIWLAAGVSKALVTTAGGLIVGIFAMFFYTIFRGRVQSLLSWLEGQCEGFAVPISLLKKFRSSGKEGRWTREVKS